MENEISEPTQEFKGKNLDEALGHAEHVLKIPREKFTYEIVTEKTKLFGIRARKSSSGPGRKRNSTRPRHRLPGALLPHFPLELTYQIKKKNETIYLIFDGEDKSMLLRKDGSLLLAFQHILNKVSPP